jgi:hypothetical protein
VIRGKSITFHISTTGSALFTTYYIISGFAKGTLGEPPFHLVHVLIAVSTAVFFPVCTPLVPACFSMGHSAHPGNPLSCHGIGRTEDVEKNEKRDGSVEERV